MQFRSLKTAIFLHLFCLLVLAMALTALAVTGLWRNQLARQAKEDLAAMTRLQAASLAPDATTRLVQLKALCAAAGNACLRVSLRGPDKELLAIGAGETAPQTASLFSDHLMSFEEYIHGGNDKLILIAKIAYLPSDFRRDLSLILSLITVNALAFATIGFFRLARGMVRPLERFADTAGRYAGELDMLFHHERGDELRRLALALRGLFARIENDNEQITVTVARLEQAQTELQARQKEIIRAEKLASIGRLAAGLAHEIGNPLGIVQGYLALLQQDDLTREDRADFASRAGAELARVNTLIKNLLDFSRPARVGRELANLTECLDKLLPVLRAQKEARGINLTVEGATTTAKPAISPDALYQVLLNCLLNAVDAIESQAPGHAGRIVIRCQTLAAPPPPRLLISIADNGGGIREEHLDSLFDPFFTTKEPGKGTGLGLAVSHSLIEAAGGTMRLTNNEEGGATAVIELPLAGSQDKGNEKYTDH